MNPNATIDDVGKFILRFTLSILILLHGIAKITGGIDHIAGMLQSVGLPATMAAGVYLGEIAGPILLLIGWYARVGAGLIAINMLFALMLVHSAELFTLAPHGGWAVELQGMFLFTALSLILTGPGRLSINNR